MARQARRSSTHRSRRSRSQRLALSRRRTRRIAAVVTVPLAGVALALFALIGTAAAYDVTSVMANCQHVTVSFDDFPDEGVTVHIEARVDGQSPVSTDIVISSAVKQAQLDISSLTSNLGGSSATIDVDVTWTLNGPQHVYKARTVTCGGTTAPFCSKS